MKKAILLVLVPALLMIVQVVRADFTFGKLTNLGPPINSSYDDGSITMTSDGLELYFDSGRQGWSLWVTKRATISDPWGEPERIRFTTDSSIIDFGPCLSADGLELYYTSNRDLAFNTLIAKRATLSDPWEDPVNIGPAVSRPSGDFGPSISADGLELFFGSDRSGGLGPADLWVTKRETINDSWTEAVNLGSAVNSPFVDNSPFISPDGLLLFFESNRPGGYGDFDIWVSKRETTKDEWGQAVNLGPLINSEMTEYLPGTSIDGRIFYFTIVDGSGGLGGYDIWHAPIGPISDLNSDLKIDTADMHIMVDHWGEYYPLCDIGPTPLGDGIVDIQDMVVLAEHLYQIAAHWKLDETDGNIAYDSYGDHDGMINGNPFWQPTGGMKGGSLMLDGIDDYIDTPFILDPSKGSFSVFAWVYSWMPGQVIISQKGESDGTWLGTNPSGMLMTGFGDGNIGTLESESFISDVQWHHVGFVYDSDTLYRRLYVDGVLVAEDTSAVTGAPSNDGLYIGASKDFGAGTLFSGFIDDVCIYKQALSTKEIETLAK